MSSQVCTIKEMKSICNLLSADLAYSELMAMVSYVILLFISLY